KTDDTPTAGGKPTGDPPAPKTPPAQERRRLTSAELKEQLSRVPELDFYGDADAFRKQLADAAADKAAKAAGDAGGKNLARDAALRALAAATPPQFNQRVNDVLYKRAKA